MTAVTQPLPTDRRHHGALRVVPAARSPRALRGRPAAARPTPGARPAAVQLRRRRAVVGLVVVVLLGAGAALGVPGGVPLTPSGRAPAAGGVPADAVSVAEASYVVRPGDTLWHIARALQPEGDVRPLVQRLAAAHGGAPLSAGERLALPPG